MPRQFIHHARRSLRYPDWDYSTPAAYFVTICTHEREHTFGEIRNGAMVLNNLGRCVEYWWLSLPSKYPNIELDQSVIMPNHIHGIIWVTFPHPVGTIHELSLPLRRRNELVPMGVGYFKMNSAKKINEMRGSTGARVWQRSYHDRIIRDKAELFAIRRYIQDNPMNWETDTYGLCHSRVSSAQSAPCLKSCSPD
jgi:REP element-mobilizing transposase RayT